MQGQEFEVGGILWSNGPISKSITKKPDREWQERSLTGGDVPSTLPSGRDLAREWHEPSDSQGSISVPI